MASAPVGDGRAVRRTALTDITRARCRAPPTAEGAGGTSAALPLGVAERDTIEPRRRSCTSAWALSPETARVSHDRENQSIQAALLLGTRGWEAAAGGASSRRASSR